MASEAPIITFKAGRCTYDPETSSSVTSDPTPGYIYLQTLEEMTHFCWRPRSQPHTNPSLDLIMFPGDATFTPYHPSNAKTAIAGRIYRLKFESSTAKYFFWLQSSPKTEGDLSGFSARDLKIGEIVNAVLKGEEVDVQAEIAGAENGGDGDEDMEDADGADGGLGGGSLGRTISGGAGAGATGGDVRDEGEGAREGGADGGRASTATAPSDPTQAAVASFLQSLSGSKLPSSSSTQTQEIFPSLPDLLPPSTTLPTLSKLSSQTLNTLLSHLPPQIALLSSGLSLQEITEMDSDEETTSAIILSLDDDVKRQILEKVLRSPQFSQSLVSFSNAVREGGLPMIAQQLGLKVDGDGLVKGGSVPLGGGSAMKALVQGYKKKVDEDDDEDEEMHD